MNCLLCRTNHFFTYSFDFPVCCYCYFQERRYKQKDLDDEEFYLYLKEKLSNRVNFNE